MMDAAYMFLLPLGKKVDRLTQCLYLDSFAAFFPLLSSRKLTNKYRVTNKSPAHHYCMNSLREIQLFSYLEKKFNSDYLYNFQFSLH